MPTAFICFSGANTVRVDGELSSSTSTRAATSAHVPNSEADSHTSRRTTSFSGTPSQAQVAYGLTYKSVAAVADADAEAHFKLSTRPPVPMPVAVVAPTSRGPHESPPFSLSTEDLPLLFVGVVCVAALVLMLINVVVVLAIVCRHRQRSLARRSSQGKDKGAARHFSHSSHAFPYLVSSHSSRVVVLYSFAFSARAAIYTSIQ